MKWGQRPAVVAVVACGILILGGGAYGKSRRPAKAVHVTDVLVTGGSDGAGHLLSSAEVYSPGSGEFSSVRDLNDARVFHTATFLPGNGKVLITGGQGASEPYLSSAELYNPKTGAFARTSAMAMPHAFQSAVLLSNRSVLVIGGAAAVSAVPCPTATPGLSELPVSSPPGAALIPFTHLSDAESFNPNRKFTRQVVPLSLLRILQTATALADGGVLVTGGAPDSVCPGHLSDDIAALYNPAKKTLAPTGSLTTPRAGHAATLLPSGKVLVTGGVDASGNILSTAELYDPASATFAPTGSMSNPRAGHAATLLQNGPLAGQVLITGGQDNTGNPLSSAEVYDPGSGTFSLTGEMSSPRLHHAASRLGDGSVLISGGQVDSGGTVTPTAELYDPMTGMFVTTGTMASPRAGHTATLLQ